MKRSGLATDGLLEMVPLTREEHDKAEEGDPWVTCFLDTNAPAHLRRMYRAYRQSDYYLGPPELVAEVRREVEAEDAAYAVLAS